MRENKVLWENPAPDLPRRTTTRRAVRARSNAADFFGQETNALDRITADFARSIVSAILEAF